MKEFITIDVSKSAKKLVSNFEQGDLVAEQILVQSMQQAVDLTATNAAVYPPTTEANQPPTPYYIRGTGTQTSNGNRGESKQLDKQWEKLVEIEGNGVVGTVKNVNAPYAPWVHGMRGQQWYHADRGWRTVKKIASDVRQGVNNIFKAGTKRFTTYLKTGKLT